MGQVHAEITLKNANDVTQAVEGSIPEDEIRQTTLNALVDTGAWTLVIDEANRKKLGLRVFKSGSGKLADGRTTNYCLAGPVEVAWKNRSTNCDAIVLPEADETLLGAIPLEAMDLMINPLKGELVGVHGDQVVHSIK